MTKGLPEWNIDERWIDSHRIKVFHWRDLVLCRSDTSRHAFNKPLKKCDGIVDKNASVSVKISEEP